MKIKKCVGVILYNNQNNIFLMTSPKWKGYVVPGGKIEKGESEEEALRREIREELGIEITNLVRVREVMQTPRNNFIDPTITFHFIDYFAKALQTEIIPNYEVSDYGWYSIDDALKLPLTDNLVREFIENFRKYIKK